MSDNVATQTPPIPLVDLKAKHAEIADEIGEAFQRVLANTAFILGSEVDAFEQAYAEYCGVGYCVGVANGTDAIELALRAAGIGAGDEVVIPANTFVATAEAVLQAGADIVLADCDENGLLDPAAVRRAITSRTRAIVPVHLYGQMAPMDELRSVTMDELRSVARDEIVLVEDAAQSQGARQDGQRSGALGIAAATSFYPGKNLGAYGDAGAVTTDDADLAERLKRLRNHGGVRKYEHLDVGSNSRLDGLQAAVLSVQLQRLDDWNERRRAAACRYDELLRELPGVTVPRTVAGNEHVWHLYVVQVDGRDEVLARLNQAGIGAGIHYPVPIHRLPAFAGLELSRGSFPVAEALAERILSLPIDPWITPEQQQRVVGQLAKALR